MAQPGIGFELECRGVQLKNNTDKAKEASNEERERIRGKELLVGDNMTKSGKFSDHWTLTAELSGPSGVNLLCPEIVVHGPDASHRRGVGQGIKLTPDNEGITGLVAGEMRTFLDKWSGEAKPTPIKDFAEYGEWSNTPGTIAYKTWGQQITAPIPLAALYAMLPEPTYEGITKQTHKFVVARGLTKVTVADLPEKLQKAGHTKPQLDALMAFLSLVVSYIRQGPLDTTTKGLKHMTPIMPRTDFATMAGTCQATISSYGSLYDLVAEVCRATKIQMDGAKLAWKGYSLAVTDWIRALPGKDLVAEADRVYRHGQVGGLGSKMEQLITKSTVEVPIFEFRDIGGCFTSEINTFMIDAEKEVRRIHKEAATL